MFVWEVVRVLSNKTQNVRCSKCMTKGRKGRERGVRSARGGSGVGLGLNRLMRIGVLPAKYNEEGRPQTRKYKGCDFNDGPRNLSLSRILMTVVFEVLFSIESFLFSSVS